MHIVYGATFYSSGTVGPGNGNSGVIATPHLRGAGQIAADVQTVVIPLYFTLTGAAMTVDETNDVTMDWYADAAGGFTFGKTTFAQITFAGMLAPIEVWPGVAADVTLWDGADIYRPPWIPAPPYVKISYALGGTAKEMSFIVTMSYLIL